MTDESPKDITSTVDQNESDKPMGESSSSTVKKRLTETEPEGIENHASPTDNIHPQSEHTPPLKAKTSFPWGLVILTVLVLVTMAAVSTIGWEGYRYLQLESGKSERITHLENSIAAQDQRVAAIGQQRVQMMAEANQELRSAKERIAVLEQRVVAQNRRLLSMSTITREDWLLAEAEYLLKLANQRILIERSVDGADALLSEADRILRDLADPDLYPLRKAVNNDLAALRLTQKIDLEGLYLSLNGLINQLGLLPLQPSRQDVLARVIGDTITDSDTVILPPLVEESLDTWWLKLQASFAQFISAMGEYVRVRDHSVEAKALLAPDTAEYLQHNIRLILERAQLALLREQPKIYTQSLQQADAYILRYYPESKPASAFRAQLQRLASESIVITLPDITPSLELLHSYIEQLHSLKGAEPSNGSVSQ
ncbi:uroporphyrinogen-III C-methyltransferase [Teredinibacter purpureus]|uniref:uroporphyrinogen-III C-methyltransferase n=1 Tax=Teredinibacter purpureus TaxID=2731756 RepID=UPI0005F7798B|nr:uroporphyrinogen-III C-methyltransferase [Teredinibacter purpureus]